MALLLRPFRVYNDIRRVGVTWKLGATTYQLYSGATALAILVITAALGAALVKLWWPATVVVVAAGLIAEMILGLVVTRLTHMMAGMHLRETTQFRLARNSVREPVYRNFRAPDQPVGDDEASTIYRNY